VIADTPLQSLNASTVSVEITDGWHAMTVSLDPLLCRLAHTKGIFVGMKLHISILQQVPVLLVNQRIDLTTIEGL